jgi:hypothetical protein
MSETRSSDAPSGTRRPHPAIIIAGIVLAVVVGIGGVIAAIATRSTSNANKAVGASSKPAAVSQVVTETDLTKAGLTPIRHESFYSSDAGRTIPWSSWTMKDGNVLTVTDNQVDTFADPGTDVLNWCAPSVDVSANFAQLLVLGSQALTQAHTAWRSFPESDNPVSNWGNIVVASDTTFVCYHKKEPSNN